MFFQLISSSPPRVALQPYWNSFKNTWRISRPPCSKISTLLFQLWCNPFPSHQLKLFFRSLSICSSHTPLRNLSPIIGAVQLTQLPVPFCLQTVFDYKTTLSEIALLSCLLLLGHFIISDEDMPYHERMFTLKQLITHALLCSYRFLSQLKFLPLLQISTVLTT